MRFCGPSRKERFIVATALLVLLLTVSVVSIGHVSAISGQGCAMTGSELSDAYISRMNQARIAVVKFVFTATPYNYYDSDYFYSFYHWADGASASHCTSKNLEHTRGRHMGALGRRAVAVREPVRRRGLLQQPYDPGTYGDPGGWWRALLFFLSLWPKKKHDVVIIGFSEYVTARDFNDLTND